MPGKRPWFRLYSEITSDRKIRRLGPEERWLWVAILCAAWESPVKGDLLVTEGIPCEIRDLADQAALDPETVEKALPKFEALNMLHREGDTWVVTNFKQRQYDKKSDWPENTRARKRAQRERESQTRLAAASAGDVSAASLTREDCADSCSSDVTPVSRQSQTGGCADIHNSPVTPLSPRDGNYNPVTSQSRGSHAVTRSGSQSALMPVSRVKDIPAAESESRLTCGQHGGKTEGQKPPPSKYSICTYPSKSGTFMPDINGHTSVTPLPRQSGIQSTVTNLDNCIAINNKYKKHDDDDNNNNQQHHHVLKDNAQKETLISLTLRQEFGRVISPAEVDKLSAYLNGGMGEEVICEAVRRAAVQGFPKVAYVVGILNNWQARGVRDMDGVQEADREFHQRKSQKGGTVNYGSARGQSNANNGQNPPKLKYAGLIPTYGAV